VKPITVYTMREISRRAKNHLKKQGCLPVVVDSLVVELSNHFLFVEDGAIIRIKAKYPSVIVRGFKKINYRWVFIKSIPKTMPEMDTCDFAADIYLTTDLLSRHVTSKQLIKYVVALYASQCIPKTQKIRMRASKEFLALEEEGKIIRQKMSVRSVI